jgi:hypothetical protein
MSFLVPVASRVLLMIPTAQDQVLRPEEKAPFQHNATKKMAGTSRRVVGETAA